MEIQSATQSALYSGAQGIARSEEQITQSAHNIATANVQNGDKPQAQEAKTEQQTSINEELVKMKVAEHEAQASAKVIQTAEDVLGTLVDVTA